MGKYHHGGVLGFRAKGLKLGNLKQQQQQQQQVGGCTACGQHQPYISMTQSQMTHASLQVCVGTCIIYQTISTQ